MHSAFLRRGGLAGCDDGKLRRLRHSRFTRTNHIARFCNLLVRFDRGLLTVADQCISQTVLERAEPAIVVPPLKEPRVENRLTDLL